MNLNVKTHSIIKAALIAAASFLIWTAGPAFAQDDDDPRTKKGKEKGKGGLAGIFRKQTKDLDPETREKVEGLTSEVEKLLDDEDAGDAVKRATEAFRENKDQIVAEGQKLIDNPDGAAEQGRKMAEDDDLRGRLEAAAGELVGEENVAAARAKAEELAKSESAAKAAAQAREAIGSDDAAAEIKPLIENAAATAANSGETTPPAAMKTEDKPPAGAIQPLVGPDGVPIPKDPVTEAIPRANRDPKKMTKITAEKSEFDANENVVTFEINVMLDHPEFDLSCDILEAELKGDGTKTAGGEVSPTQQAASGGIKRAEARGYVQIEKISPEGKAQVAIARLAVYEAETGDVILSDYPMLQDGENLIRGKSEDTKILLRQDGTHKVLGLADYEFVSEKNAIEFKPRGKGN